MVLPAVVEIAVEVELQTAADLILAAELLHHHLRRILDKGLGEHPGALHLRTGDLVRPVLMRQLYTIQNRT